MTTEERTIIRKEVLYIEEREKMTISEPPVVFSPGAPSLRLRRSGVEGEN